MNFLRNTFLGFALLLCLHAAHADDLNIRSIYRTELSDPSAVYLKPGSFNVSADGTRDDAPAIQAAIDSLLETDERGGIVYVPQGTYRLGGTLRLWQGIRLVGYGTERPVFKLAENTPGFQDGFRRYLIQFCEAPKGASRPTDGLWKDEEVTDAGGGTHFSGIININFQIEDGNPAAVAVSYGAARNSVLKNIDFSIGGGLGAIDRIGNVIENCNIYGGAWAIYSERSSMDLPALVKNCIFDGQREQAIYSFFSGFTVMGSAFKNMPIGILGRVFERIYISDSSFENIDETALRIRNYVSPELHVNLHNLKFSDVPFSVRFSGRAAGWNVKELKWVYEAPASQYEIKSFSHGRHITIPNTAEKPARFATHLDQAPIETFSSLSEEGSIERLDIVQWANVAELGAEGDGQTDSWKPIQKAIDESESVYFPMGEYVVSKPLRLKKDSRLIGLHPGSTRIVLKDAAHGFEKSDDVKSLIQVPEKGSARISGLGFDLGNNPGAVGMLFDAAQNVSVSDVYFGSGGMTGSEDARHAGSLWIQGHSSGDFQNIWLSDSRSAQPFYMKNTEKPGRVYQMSVDHHGGYEMELDGVENWSFFGVDIHESSGGEARPGIMINTSKNLLFANLSSRRGPGLWEPSPYAIKARDVRQLTICGAEFTGAVFPYENAFIEETMDASVFYRVFSNLKVNP
ncbi:MAG: glycosyl hydrolase family 28-related protein [Opitutales bacterium]